MSECFPHSHAVRFLHKCSHRVVFPRLSFLLPCRWCWACFQSCGWFLLCHRWAISSDCSALVVWNSETENRPCFSALPDSISASTFQAVMIGFVWNNRTLRSVTFRDRTFTLVTTSASSWLCMWDLLALDHRPAADTKTQLEILKIIELALDEKCEHPLRKRHFWSVHVNNIVLNIPVHHTE